MDNNLTFPGYKPKSVLLPINYYGICLCIQKHVKNFKVHRLVDNPDNLPVVGHKDRDKHNNASTNLRFVAYQLNSLNGGVRPVIILDEDDNMIELYESVLSAAERCGKHITIMQSYIKDGNPHHGYKYKYY